MTFGELTTLVRREIIVDDYADAFLDADIEETLWRASVEIAAAFDFPRAVVTAAVTAGATTIAVPADCIRVQSVSVGGDDGVSVSLKQLGRMAPGERRPLRYFNYDPRRAGGISIAPASPGGTATIEYTQSLTRPASFAAGTPWSGVLAQFHAVIAYRAGVALFQMDERENEVQHWQNEYQLRITEMGYFLGNTNVSQLLVAQALQPQGGSQ